MFDKKIVGQQTRQIRTDRNIRQDEVASSIGISKQMLSNIETGYRDATLEVAVALALYFNVSLDYLCGLSNEPKRR